MLKKIFLALLALFFIFIGSVWLLISYVRNHPDFLSQSVEKAIHHFTAGVPYEEKHEEVLHNIQHVLIQSQNAPLEIHMTDKTSLQILFQGKVPKSESGPFIISQTQGVKTEINLREPISSHFFQMNINGQNWAQQSDSELKAQVYVPKSFKGTLRIQTQQANVEIIAPNESPIQFDLKSNRGNIENLLAPPGGPLDPNQITIIEVQSHSGNISIHPE